MVDQEERRFLVIVRVNKDDTARAAAWILDRAKGLAGDDHRLAFSSLNGETFGVFLKARKAAVQIRAALDQFSKGGTTFVLVVELGADWAGVGNSRAWEWLQHH